LLEAIIHGITLAFGLILPLGAQNVFVFNQGAAQKQFSKALPVIITASVCDTLLIVLAVLGVSVIVLTLNWIKLVLFVVGFFFLLYMGWNVWNSDTKTEGNKQTSLSAKQQILFALSVSLLNPHAILDTIGVIGTNSLSYERSEKIGFTLACIIVSWTWFFGLGIAGRKIGKMDTRGRWIQRLNKVSAVIIWAVALYIGWQIVLSV
jgi:L-lysine exporter family protein LysE/ArgO